MAISEIVDETMSNAARVHTVEQGHETSDRTLIAFGGAAPLHIARVAEKLKVKKVIIPTNASVGSAVGFLKAPLGYEIVKSLRMLLKEFLIIEVNLLLEVALAALLVEELIHLLILLRKDLFICDMQAKVMR